MNDVLGGNGDVSFGAAQCGALEGGQEDVPHALVAAITQTADCYGESILPSGMLSLVLMCRSGVCSILRAGAIVT